MGAVRRLLRATLITVVESWPEPHQRKENFIVGMRPAALSAQTVEPMSWSTIVLKAMRY